MGKARDGMSENIRQLSRFKYGRDRDVIMKEMALRSID